MFTTYGQVSASRGLTRIINGKANTKRRILSAIVNEIYVSNVLLRALWRCKYEHCGGSLIVASLLRSQGHLGNKINRGLL